MCIPIYVCVYLYMYVYTYICMWNLELMGFIQFRIIYTLNYYDIIDLDIHVFPVRKRI